MHVHVHFSKTAMLLPNLSSCIPPSPQGRVKRELLEAGMQLEEYGGDVQAVEISALRGEGLEALDEALLAQADLCEIKADFTGPLQGIVIETRVDKRLG